MIEDISNPSVDQILVSFTFKRNPLGGFIFDVKGAFFR